MNTNTKSVSKVNVFFNKLKKYNSHNIIIYSNQENSLRDAIISDGRSNKISKIDGELITVKPNIKVANFPYTGGIKHFEGSVSKDDDPIIKRIRENGGIMIQIWMKLRLVVIHQQAFMGDVLIQIIKIISRRIIGWISSCYCIWVSKVSIGTTQWDQ